MALELRITGPGLDVVRTLQAGEPELVLGRDADCGVCLPDPQRNVSRRHLSVWLEDDTLRFRVLSVVNGVETPFAEAPPGALGTLPIGQTLKLGEYSISVSPAATTEADAWAALEREGSGATSALPVAPAPAEDDPFGDWGFQSTFGPGAPGGGPLDAKALGLGDMSDFFRGLGMDTAGTLSQGELEAIGRAMRILVLGVLELHASVASVKHQLRAEDRTMLAPPDNNPLKADWPKESKLRYLFAGRAAGGGFLNPERALRELLAELIAHNGASAAAACSALESTLGEFAPDALKSRLLGGGAKLFESARAWDAYSKYYEEEGRDMARWTQRLLDRYFAEAYVRESLRIRRETPAPGA
jgi:predicted component of type VI protein secretion system